MQKVNTFPNKKNIAPAFLNGGGEMGELTRSFNWEITSLGMPNTWPQSLRTTLSIMLNSKLPMFLWWGADLIQFYNDAYRPSLGQDGKHPLALGQKGADCWPEIWATIKPLIDEVNNGNEGTWSEDLLLPIFRNGQMEDVYWTFGYSPVIIESGAVGGVLVTVIETTEKVKAAKVLQASEQRFQNLVNEISVGIIILRGEEMIVDLVNDQYGQLIQVTSKDLLGKKLFDVIPDAEEEFRPFLDKVRTTGESVYFYDQLYSVVTNGNRVEGYLNAVYQPYKEHTGEITGVIALCQDVTEAVTGRKKIEKNEQDLKRYKHMADNATDAFILMKEDGTFAYLNDLALERWGYTKEEAQHLRVPDVDPIYNDDVFKKAFAAAQEGKLPQFETVHRKKDGTVYRVEINMGGLMLEGVPHMFAVARDITERKKLEKAVQESEERIRNFILQAPVAMCLYRGSDHVIEIVNEAILKIWDKSLEDVINKPVFDALPMARGQGFEELLKKVYTTGEQFSSFGVPVALSRYGKPITLFVNLVYQAYREVNGEITGIVEVVSDVTEQVVATQQIAASEQRFGAAIEAVQGIVWTNNARGEMEGEQKGWAALTGQTYEAYQGFGWATALHPDDALPTIEAWNEAVKACKTFVFEHRVKTKSGEWGMFSVRAIPLLQEDGSIREWIGVHTNITEQKEAEEKIIQSEKQFRTFADSIPILAWIADGDGWIYWYNQQWYDYTGTTLDEMIGWGWQRVHHPDHVESIVATTKGLWKKGESFELTFPLLRHDGKYHWFLTRAYPVKDSAGKIEKWIGTNTDITDQKNFNEALEQKVTERTKELKATSQELNITNKTLESKNKELDVMNKELQSFAYISSHDLQEPLRKIQTFADLLSENERDNLSEYGMGILSRMHNAAERMQLLITDLLEYSRTSTTEKKFEKVNLSTIVERVIISLKEEIEQKNAIIDNNNLSEVDVIPFQFEQVFSNLITNALKFSKAEERLHITIKSKHAKGSDLAVPILQSDTVYCNISFSDNGIGFESIYKERIFEMFQRLHGKSEYKGTGIGLAIVKKIVENHNGFITAKGELGRGAAFEIYIPCN